jgi:CheY-like chemotaxis protein
MLRLLETAQEGARRGAALTQRMLAFARRQPLKPSVVDLPDLVRGMTDLLRRSIGPGIIVETQFSLELPKVTIDANQLELALLNLALNARDAMPDGGTILIAAREAQCVHGVAAGRYVCLSVTDTGLGMDADTLARAQEPFFTTKGVGKGTGLGLSMVQGLAEQSSGRLVLKSRPGEGTTAEIWLPVSHAEQDAAPAASPAPAGRQQVQSPVLSTLVVDDDLLVLENTVAMLEDMGHRVIAARSGEEAQTLVRHEQALDLVITDHAMPGITGLQLADWLRAERPNIRVLLASGFADISSGSRSDLPRLSKPFDQSALDEAICSVMSTFQFQGKRAPELAG